MATHLCDHRLIILLCSRFLGLQHNRPFASDKKGSQMQGSGIHRPLCQIALWDCLGQNHEPLLHRMQQRAANPTAGGHNSNLRDVCAATSQQQALTQVRNGYGPISLLMSRARAVPSLILQLLTQQKIRVQEQGSRFGHKACRKVDDVVSTGTSMVTMRPEDALSMQQIVPNAPFQQVLGLMKGALGSTCICSPLYTFLESLHESCYAHQQAAYLLLVLVHVSIQVLGGDILTAAAAPFPTPVPALW